MKKSIATIIFASIVLVGCATFPQSREYEATQHVNGARKAFSEGDNTTAANQIRYALASPTGDTKVKELFARYPKDQDNYYAYLQQGIADVPTATSPRDMLRVLNITKSAGIFSETQANELLANLNKVVASGNKTGAIPIYLGDNIDAFPDLRLPEHQQIIVDRTIKLRIPRKLDTQSTANWTVGA